MIFLKVASIALAVIVAFLAIIIAFELAEEYEKNREKYK